MLSRPLSVRTRLIAAFGVIALLVLLLAGLALSALVESNRDFDAFVNGVNARALKAAQVRNAVDRRAIAARNLLLVTHPDDLAAEKAAASRAHEEVRSGLEALGRMIAAGADASDEARRLAAEIGRVEAAYGPVALAIVELASAGKTVEAAAKINGECRPLLAKLVAASDAYAGYTAERARAATEEAVQHHAQQRIWLLTGCLTVFLVAATAGVLITRGIARALGAEPAELGRIAQRVAEGDLAVIGEAARAPAGSVMASLAEMQRALARIVAQVRSASAAIAAGSTQIATGNADLSQRTEQQAANLQQTAATMEQITGSVRASADTACRVDHLAAEASAAATEGGQAVGRVVATMDGISDASKRIAEIIGVIDGIAFQTNILALNAAVEAARAGEQGRGFAVVAAEVRSLAQRASAAAREIKDLIDDSVGKVESGARQAAEAGQTMDGIVGRIHEVSRSIEQISRASAEQSDGVGQVGQAIGQLDQVTQRNAALVEESAAASESLRQQALRLDELVAVFRLEGAPGRG